MKLANIDRHPSGNFPLQLVVRWLDTLTRSPAVTWAPGQLAAAQEAVTQARELLDTDVLTLAGRHFPRQGVATTPPQLTDGHDAPEPIRERIDRVERETLGMAPLAGFCRCGIPTADCHPECPHGPRVKYGEPQAPAEHGERLEAALRAAQGHSVDLRSVAQAVAGAVPPGTDVRLTVDENACPACDAGGRCTAADGCVAFDNPPAL